MAKRNGQEAYPELQTEHLKRREEQTCLRKEEKPSVSHVETGYRHGHGPECPFNV